MNILIDIGHPAHVHYYRNLARKLITKNHKVLWTIKDIPVVKRLLDYYGFEYHVLPKKKDSLSGKILSQIRYIWLLWKVLRKEKIDYAIGTSASIAHMSKITKVISIVFDDDDDEVQPLITKYVNPYASELLSPEALKGKRKRMDTIYYAGYHELAYLHPSSFAPDLHVLRELGISPAEKYFIMRFNVFKAHHDVGVKGLSLHQKMRLVELLKPYGRIFITTERQIEPELTAYKLKIAPEKIHSLMANATMFIGDSQTMTSEAAMLGVPSLRCNSFAKSISYLTEQEEKYGLTYAFLPEDFDKMEQKLKELLELKDLKKEWQNRRDKMLFSTINVTDFWAWFVENYPESGRIMKENPDYQYKFL